MYVDAPVVADGAMVPGQEVTGFQQVVYAAPPPMVATPARINVSPEIFAKLAAGGSLTPDEMAQLSGQPAPGPVMPGSPQRPGSAKASGKKDKKSEKSGSKK